MKKRFVVVIKKILTNILNGKFRFGKKSNWDKKGIFEILWNFIYVYRSRYQKDLSRNKLSRVFFANFMKVECFGLIYSTKTVQFNEKYVERTNWPSSWSRKIEIHHGYSLPLKYRDVILSQSLAKTLLFLRSMARRVKPDGKLKVTASHDTYIPSRINTGVKIFLAGNIIFCLAYEYQEFKISRAF